MRRLVLAALARSAPRPRLALAPRRAALGSPRRRADGATQPRRRLASQRQVALATPGDFTGHGFDQCLAPTQSAMDTWWKKSPFSAVGIYISGDSRACRSQPNLSPTWVAAQVARGWRLLPIALGPQASCQPRFPRYKDDFTISPKPAERLRQGRRARAPSRPTRTPPTRWRTASGRAARSGTTSRASTSATPHCRESALVFMSALGDPDQGARLRRRLLLQRQLGHQDARRRARPAARPVRAARPHLDRPLGRRRRHLHDVHPRGRLASRRPDEAVPRRPQRDVGRGHDQHRQQLPRPRRRLRRRARGPLPRHPARLLEVPDADPHRRPADAGQGAAVPAHRAGHLLRPDQRRVRRRDDRGGARVAGDAGGSPRPTPSRSGTGRRCWPPARVRRSSAGRSTSRSTGCSGRSTRPAPDASGRAGSSTPRPRRRCGPTSHACGSWSPASRRRRPGTSCSRAGSRPRRPLRPAGRPAARRRSGRHRDQAEQRRAEPVVAQQPAHRALGGGRAVAVRAPLVAEQPAAIGVRLEEQGRERRDRRARPSAVRPTDHRWSIATSSVTRQ